MNNSTSLQWGGITRTTFHPYLMRVVGEIQLIILSVMFLGCIFGNVLISSVIVKTRKLRTPSNLLLVNLSVCDAVTVVTSLPFNLILYVGCQGDNVGAYPHGQLGCRVLWPITTYAMNCSVFTLATIAIDRYLNLSSQSKKLTKRKTILILILLHISAILTVLPNSIHLKYVGTGNSKYSYCYLEWTYTWGRHLYNIILFLLQYAVPLGVMICYYSLAWRKIYIHNNTIIKMSEDYERKISDMGFQPKLQKVTYIRPRGNRGNEIVTETTSADSTKHDKFTEPNTKCNGSATTKYKIDSYSSRIEKSNSFKIFLKKSTNMIGVQANTRGKKLDTHDKNTIKSTGCPRLMLAMQKEYEARAARHNNPANQRECRRFSKSRYTSQTAYFRNRQSTRLLKMFTILVAVYTCFGLPNQILSLQKYYPFLPPVIADILIILSYVNPMINCWIYSWFDTRIRTAYIKTICCASYQRKMMDSITYTSANQSPSLYDSRTEAIFHIRKTSFNRMFAQHSESFRTNLQKVSEAKETSVNMEDDFLTTSDDSSGGHTR